VKRGHQCNISNFYKQLNGRNKNKEESWLNIDGDGEVTEYNDFSKYKK